MPINRERQGAYDDSHRNPLHGVRCRHEIRPGFMLKVSPTPVAHVEEGIGLPADRCRFGRFDQIYGDVW